MRCKTCDYPLWAIKTRQCPECGRPFAPSEYEFVPGSVRYACPHCDQPYYGTSSSGHLIPAAFNCVKCGRPVQMDEMVLFPAEGVQERQTQLETQPWLERGERGRVGSWFRTIGLALVGPQRLMKYTPVESPVGTAWWFAMVTQFVYSMVGFFPLLLFPIVMISFMKAKGGVPMAGVGVAMGGVVLAAMFGPLVLMAIWGLVTHGVLKITGGAAYSIGRTYQAICYSSGANVLMAVPCFGLHLTGTGISSVWWIVSAVLMVKEGQRVHGGRAALAVLVFPAVLFLGLVTIIVLSVVAVSKINANVQARQASSGFAQKVDALQIQTAMTLFASHHQGQGPGHALELLSGNYLNNADVFLLSDAEARKAKVPLGDKTLADFATLSLEEQRQVMAAAAQAAAGQTAYRLGDIVFTYPGVDFTRGDPGLWLFILWPDVATGGDATETVVTAVTRTGTTQLNMAEFDTALAEQNKLRAKNGLRALPSPDKVGQLPVGSVSSRPEAEER